MKGVFVDKNNLNVRIRIGTQVDSFQFRDTPAEKFIKFLRKNDPVEFSVKKGTDELTFCSKIKNPDEFPEGCTDETSQERDKPEESAKPKPEYKPYKNNDFIPASQVKTQPQVTEDPAPYIPDEETLIGMSGYSEGYWRAKFLKDIHVQREIRAEACLNTATNIVSQWRDAQIVKPNELGRIVMEVATDLQAYVVLSSSGDVGETIAEWNQRMRELISGKKPNPEPIPDEAHPEPIPKPPEKSQEQPKKPEFEGKVVTNLPKTSGNYNGDNRTDMDQGEMDFVDDSYLAGC